MFSLHKLTVDFDCAETTRDESCHSHKTDTISPTVLFQRLVQLVLVLSGDGAELTNDLTSPESGKLELSAIVL